MSDWLIDYCLTSSEQYYWCILHEDMFNINYREMRVEGWVNLVNDIWMPLKRCGELVGNHLILCSGYSAPNLLWNLQKRYFACSECTKFHTRYRLEFTDRLSYYYIDIPMLISPYYPPSGDTLSSSVSLSHGNLHKCLV